MNANQACFPIATVARMLGVSKAGYHAWLHRPPSAQAVADEALLKRVLTVHTILHAYLAGTGIAGDPRSHCSGRLGAARGA